MSFSASSHFGDALVECRVARWYIFNPKIQIWVNFGGSLVRDVGIFYVHLVYFTAICHTLWTFDIFPGYLEYFFPFWYVVARKIWQPWPNA
jgi:hypothetical protein